MDKITLLITGGGGYVSSVLIDIIQHSAATSTSTSANANNLSLLPSTSGSISASDDSKHSNLKPTSTTLHVGKIILIDCVTVTPKLPAELKKAPVKSYQVSKKTWPRYIPHLDLVCTGTVPILL